MKKILLFSLIIWGFLLHNRVDAANITWTGSFNSNWNNALNWSGYAVPVSTDNVSIGSTTNMPNVNVASSCATLTITGATTITLSNTLSISGFLTINASTTFAGSSALQGDSVQFSAANTLTINTPVNFSGRALFNANTTITGTNTFNAFDGVLNYNSNLTLNTSATFVHLVGVTTNTTSTITIASGKTLTAFGYTVGGGLPTTLNLAGGGTSSLTGITFFGYQCQTTVAAGSTVNFGPGATLSMGAYASGYPFLTNNGTINFNGTSGAKININNYFGEIYNNNGIINLTYTNFNFAAGNSSINNTGTITANNSTINFAANAYINNSGVFNGGVSSAGTAFNLNSSGAYITNTGIFNLGSTSIINLTGANTYVQNSSGTFTLQSDVNGTGAIGNITGSSASATGQFTVQRYFTGGAISNRGYRLMSSPVNNSNTLPMSSGSPTYNFTSLKTNLLITCKNGSSGGCDAVSGYTANGPTILLYNEPTSLFVFPNNLSDYASTPVGKGFYFFFRGNNSSNVNNKLIRSGGVYAAPEANVVGLFSGTLNQGSLTYNLTGTSAAKFNLIGNPYPSSIVMTSAVLSAANTTGYIYLYDPAAKSCNPFSPSSKTIACGQGFFVKLNSGVTSSTITFTEALKSTTNLGSGLLMGLPVSTKEGIIDLRLVQDSASYDLAQLHFLDSYNKNYNEMEDADDMNGSAQTAYFGAMTADNHEVAIASQPLEKDRTSVFLSVDMSAGGQFSIEKLKLTGISELYDVWLMDHYKNDSLNLRTDSKYIFNLDKSIAATYGNSRFEVVIRKKSLLPYQLISFDGKHADKDNVLNWNTLNEYAYTTFSLERSLDGKTYEDVFNVQSDGKGTYSFTDPGASAYSFYRLKQVDVNGAVTYSTVFITGITTGGNVFTVYPNPTSNAINYALSKDVTTSSNFQLNVYSQTGSRVKTKKFSSLTGNIDVATLKPGIYTIDLVDNQINKILASAKFAKQ